MTEKRGSSTSWWTQSVRLITTITNPHTGYRGQTCIEWPLRPHHKLGLRALHGAMRGSECHLPIQRFSGCSRKSRAVQLSPQVRFEEKPFLVQHLGLSWNRRTSPRSMPNSGASCQHHSDQVDWETRVRGNLRNPTSFLQDVSSLS